MSTTFTETDTDRVIASNGHASDQDPFETDEGKELPAGRRLILGGDPDAPAKTYGQAAFDSAGEEFLPDPRLDEIAEALIGRHRLDAGDVVVLYRWKDKGGETNGSQTLGKCVKLSGHARHFAEADYLIWLAADHCRTNALTAWQLEALLFHELLHITLEENGKGEKRRKIQGHDAELFVAEFRHYGAWKLDLERVGRAVRQMLLGLSGAAD